MLLLLALACGWGGSPTPITADRAHAPPEPPSQQLAFVREVGDRRHVCFKAVDAADLTCPESTLGGFPGPVDPRGEAVLIVSAEDDEHGHREHLALLYPSHPERLQPLTPRSGRVRSPAWSHDGAWLAFESDAEGFSDLWRVDRSGLGLGPLVSHPAGNFEPSLHPSNDTVLFISSRAGGADLWQASPTGEVNPIPSSDRDELSPAWSPDGERYAFLSDRTGNRRVWVSRANHRDARMLLPDDPGEHLGFAWAPDSRHLAITTGGPGRDTDLALVDSEANRAVQRLAEPGAEEHPAWSADGEWIAFTCPTQEGSGICIATRRGKARRVVVDIEGGHAWLPRWIGDPVSR